EYLPDWAQPATGSATTALIDAVGPGIYLDTRPDLRSAKARMAVPLYYRTDTHWNRAGAWVAYRSLANELGRTEPQLRWLSYRDARITGLAEREGGDLANFLWLTDWLRDQKVIFDFEPPSSIEQVDPATGRVIDAGGDPLPSDPMQATLVRSPNAFNHAKVLWLHDSFGTALAPFMAATFTEILQLHYHATDPVLFAELVRTFKPDYVLVSVVERDVRVDWFVKTPGR
ncbi:MAG: alginate O-acetyltransferase AlgX-related protein, partial [Arenimonas sp.]